MSQFIESIRIEDASIQLLDYHNERFNATRKLFFCVDEEWNLKHFIQIPDKYKTGVVKCRIVYDIEIRDIQFSFYKPQNIEHLKMVNASIRYAYKSKDRSKLDQLKNLASPADEVLIVNDGKISDSSYSNIIFRKNEQWFTSDSPILAGVMRESLLNDGLLEEIEILPEDLKRFDAFMLINAMLDFDESRTFPILNIINI
jgi:4-amino-4-deoxychorismate lyase